jgi:hypothetical protein
MLEDTFRINARPLSDEQIELVQSIKTEAGSLLEMFNKYEHADKRMLALAKTNLEQSVMWAVKAIT